MPWRYCADRTVEGPLALAAGLAAGFYVPSTAGTVIWPVVLILAAFAISTARPRVGPLLFAVGLLLGFGGGLGARSAHVPRFGLPPEAVSEVSGTLLWDSARSQDRTAYDLELESCRGNGICASASGRIRVYAQSGVKGYWGDSVSVNGVQIGSSPVGYAQSVDVDIDGTTAQRLRARIQRSVLPSSEDAPVTAGKALFVALVAGVKDDLDPAIARLFRVSGCSHLLALSGMHLGLLCAVPALLLKRRIGPRKAAVVATVIAAVYVFFIGPKPSLLRAAVMYAAATYCFYRDTRVASVSILSISFVILITVLPASALDVSFQLSFLALSGILLFAPIAARYASRWIPPGVASAVCAAFGAQLATVGLVAKVFGVVYPVGMIASIVLLPVIILHVGAGILLGIGGMARLLPQALVDAGLELTHALVAEIARFFASAPQLAVGGPGPWALLGLPILLFAAGRVASTIRRAR